VAECAQGSLGFIALHKQFSTQRAGIDLLRRLEAVQRDLFKDAAGAVEILLFISHVGR